MRRRDFLSLTAAAGAACSGTVPAPDARRPNFVFILVDDLRWDELGCMGHPVVRTPSVDRLAAEGAIFANAFHVAPLCSPARACFLTGQYPSANGIVDNTARGPQSHRLATWPRILHGAGYETAYVGKWHMGNDDTPRPGFDRWVSFPGQGTYIDPTINEDGALKKVPGYTTDIFTDYAVEFVKQPRNRPFCLYLAHKALHPEIQQRDDGSTEGESRFIPAERHARLYEGAEIPRRPNYGKPPAGKPALERRIRGLPPLGPETVTDDETIRMRWRELAAVDEGLGRILDALVEAGAAEDTLVVFAGDNGYFYGEHGLSHERRLAYEESVRMPLVARYPRSIRPGTRIEEFALSIDIAPTALDVAGAGIPSHVEGRSLAPLWRGETSAGRDRFFIEYWSDIVFPRIERMGYDAVRTKRWKYIRFRELEGMDEFYDLAADPYELRNAIADAELAAPLAEAKALLDAHLSRPRTPAEA